MIKKTIGGERLGSGNKMKAAMHNYERSTHDLGNAWRSSMAPGVLVPFYKKLATNGDTWTIQLNELVRTMPSIGPCFGSYKLQLDIFEVPIRLYNGILHNNMTKIGMDMSKVKLPKMTLYHDFYNRDLYLIPNEKTSQIATDSLQHYLGMKGLGYCEMRPGKNIVHLERTINAVPTLAYYDIFKNYYANKQEENAYVIDHNIQEYTITNLTKAYYQFQDGRKWGFQITNQTEVEIEDDTWQVNRLSQEWNGSEEFYYNKISEMAFHPLILEWNGTTAKDLFYVEFYNMETGTFNKYDQTNFTYEYIEDKLYISLTQTQLNDIATDMGMEDKVEKIALSGIYYLGITTYTDEIKLQKFKLSNIDDMRIWLLSNTQLSTELNINNFKRLPYTTNYDKKEDNNSGCKNSMAGLVLKTYQSDMFNNWLSKEWIDGINGINAISAVNVEENKFTIDALNLAHKVYNMLNRIAISGGTYEDWQEAVYGEDAIRRAESPIYCGGASGIITFEEVVSTADTNTPTAGDQPLGSLAGKGVLTNTQGGNIEIHIKEPSYVIGIASITPLIDYAYGNDFDITELDSLNDLHKPELDEIGFQDLMIERAAWWGKVWDDTEEEPEWHNYAGGKLPAWIEYMTSVNEVHGDFADRNKLGWMVLNREYEIGWGARGNTPMPEETTPLATVPIKDWTTYVNPTAFNYQFANTKLNAQNFWVQIGINAEVRRKISAKLIPNL